VTFVLLIMRTRLGLGFSDFDPIVVGARQILAGRTPYTATPLPGLTWPIFYPAPTLVFGLLFSALPVSWAHPIFVGLASGFAAWGLSRDSDARLMGFATWPFALSAILGQWAPALLAAATIPALGWIAILKPNLGLALAIAYGHTWIRGSARRINIAAIALLVTMSFVLRPTWISEWLTLMRTPHEYFLMPVTVLGGPLMLLALLRWRRPEARFLAVLACIPQTFSSYDALLLFLVVRTRRESLILVSLMLVVTALIGAFGVSATYTETVHSWAPVRIALVYLPAVAMVLRRRNEGPAPVWLDKALTSAPRWLRGQSLDGA
jgi:hypothetical protein